jgi:hypothetical protein
MIVAAISHVATWHMSVKWGRYGVDASFSTCGVAHRRNRCMRNDGGVSRHYLLTCCVMGILWHFALTRLSLRIQRTIPRRPSGARMLHRNAWSPRRKRPLEIYGQKNVRRITVFPHLRSSRGHIYSFFLFFFVERIASNIIK